MRLRHQAIISLIILLALPLTAVARKNTVNVGLSLALDLDERNNLTSEDSTNPGTVTSEDDYRAMVLSPSIDFISRSPRNSFQLRAAPQIKYDLLEYSTDLDNDFLAAFDQSLSRNWQIQASNRFIISDYYNGTSDNTVYEPLNVSETVEQEAEVPNSDPELSPDVGRKRYWRNTLQFGTTYQYGHASQLGLDLNYIALRNEQNDVSAYEDYDRYSATLSDRHRFTRNWLTDINLTYVRGDYKPTGQDAPSAVVDAIDPDSDLSNDLKEYHLLLTLENSSIIHNPLSLNYNYIGTKYDEMLQNDGEVQQMRFTWQREISAHLSSKLGLGPSYEKTENQDANWGGNGVVELNYEVARGSFSFLVDKRYDVKNFNGTDQRGFVDLWTLRTGFDRLLTRDITLDGYLSYLNEQGTDGAAAIDRIVADTSGETPDQRNLASLGDYTKERYIAGVGLSYSFLRNYSARVSYTFTKQESDILGDDYDDHRLYLTLSWNRELFRW